MTVKSSASKDTPGVRAAFEQLLAGRLGCSMLGQ